MVARFFAPPLYTCKRLPTVSRGEAQRVEKAFSPRCLSSFLNVETFRKLLD